MMGVTGLPGLLQPLGTLVQVIRYRSYVRYSAIAFVLCISLAICDLAVLWLPIDIDIDMDM